MHRASDVAEGVAVVLLRAKMSGLEHPRTPICPDFRRLLREADPDASVINQVARCYERQLLDFAKAYCKNPTLAEDTVQETMLTMMRALHTYRGDGPLEAWLNRLVVTSCARQRRGMANAGSMHEPVETFEFEAPTAPQDVQLLLKEQLQFLANALTSVTEPNRSILLRHEAGDESLESLAANYGLTIDGVKARLKRTRADLRERLLARSAE
jgi:RNA polymerase sigma factor (sigma-70 family)